MRVLHVSQPTSEGTAVVVRRLVELGCARADDVVVACPQAGPLRDWVLAAGAKWLDLPTERSPRLADLWLAWRLRRELARFDVVHAHSSKGGAIVRLAAVVGPRALKQRVVFMPHGWSWSVGGRMRAVYAVFERLMARACGRIVAVSHSELEEGRRVLGDAAPLLLVENAVDTDMWTPDGETAVRGSAPLVVCVGRLTCQKGQDRLVRALAQLPDVRLRLVGDGEWSGYLRTLAAECGVTDRLEMVGTTDPAPHIRAADLVAVPSRWEGMSIALLEAMSLGAAIIATPEGSSGALADAGVTLSNPGDDDYATGLAAAIAELVASPERRRHYGAAARERAVERYSARTWNQRFVGLWDGLGEVHR